MKKLYTREVVMRIANEGNFLINNTEKVMRLCDVLEFFNTDDFCKGKFALKGGTAINLLFANMPRLSVDIDLDFAENVDKDKMVSYRDEFRKKFAEYIINNDYRIIEHPRTFYALDSYLLSYISSNGNRDNIKIEVNYVNRTHILPLVKSRTSTKIFSSEFDILTLNPIELYASKINALLTRATPRDLFDTNVMLENRIIQPKDYELLRKCLVFYNMISGEQDIDNLKLKNVSSISFNAIKTQLKPMLKKDDKLDVETAKEKVIKFIHDTIVLTSREKEFVKNFKEQNYNPELLFEDIRILKQIQSHPMALWRCKKREN